MQWWLSIEDGPLLMPKIRPSLGLSPQNGRRPVRDVAELPCKILCRSESPGWEIHYLTKKVKKAQ